MISNSSSLIILLSLTYNSKLNKEKLNQINNILQDQSDFSKQEELMKEKEFYNQKIKNLKANIIENDEKAQQLSRQRLEFIRRTSQTHSAIYQLERIFNDINLVVKNYTAFLNVFTIHIAVWRWNGDDGKTTFWTWKMICLKVSSHMI